MTTNLESLKALLTNQLAEKELDYGKILSLANEISKLDHENVRFSVDASHVYRLGIELVSKQETAVAELIKNAYDADAIQVDLIFKDSDVKGGTLEIIDNGDGMSRERLVNGFMRISTQVKVKAPVSEKYSRQRAGRKGIGRFAAQRLGKKLIITTQEELTETSLYLEIDWNLFEGGKDLNLISNQIKVGPKLPYKGTTLKILDLRDSWTEAQVQRTFRYISELLQPFPLNIKSDKSTNSDPGFKATFFREQHGDLVTVASEEQAILSHALAKISGDVDSTGVPYIKIVSQKYKIDLRKQLEFDQRLKLNTSLKIEEYPLLADIKFNAFYFITDELPAGTRSLAREVLNRQGGIRIYRNGFRVLPYGEAFDDWLGLQRSSALRALLPPHHNTNFIGFVEIIDVKGERFEETASREGLLENEAFLQLQDFVYRGILAGVIELAQARNKKVFAGDEPPKKPESGEKPSPRDQAATIANMLRSAAQSSASPSNATPTIPAGTPLLPAPDIDSLADQVEQLGLESQEVLEENGMLRVLASLGLTIGEFTHEVRHALAALTATITLISREISPTDDLYPSSESMKENIELLRSYVRYFDNAVTQNAHRKLEVHELRDLVNEFAEVVKPTLERQKIDLSLNFQGYDLFTKPMHKSEWASVFLNLFTNSMKAIHRAGSNGKIRIETGTTDDRLYIEFADNGDGIPLGNQEKIFNAFFTTSTPPNVLSADSDKLVGTGLGLKIVRDILDAANGEINIVSAPKDYSTCFRMEIPRAKDQEIGDAKY